MAITFPSSPSTNDTFTVNGRTYVWDGTAWKRVNAEIASVVPSLEVTGDFTGDTDTLYVDSTNDRVGIGTTSPQNELHIQDGSSGATADTGTYTQFVVEDSTNAGIHLISPDTGVGRVMMGTPSRQFGSLMRWDYPNLTYDIGTDEASGEIALRTGNFAERVRIDSSGNVGIGTTTPDRPLVVAESAAVKASIGSGVAYNSSHNFIVDSYYDGGLAVYTGNNRVGYIRFGSPSGGATAGGFSYSHTYNTLNIRTSGTDRMSIDSSGRVTMPYQPSFDAYYPAQTGTDTVVTFSLTRHNTGNHYNTSNGRFTAPIAGVYCFRFSLLMGNPFSSSNYVRVWWRVNGSNHALYGDTLADNGGHSTYVSVQDSLVVKLSANDTVEVWNDGPTQTYGQQYGAFGGFLVG